MRKSPYGRTRREFVSIAMKLGMVKDPRGTEPNYVRKSNPHLNPPLSIPGHATEFKPGTAISIIDALLNYIDQWEQHLMEQDNEESN